MGSLQTTFDDLLAWENENDVLRFRFQYEGIHAWPLIRCTVFNKIIENRMNFQLPHASKEKLKFSEKVYYLYKTIKDNPFTTNKKFDILFFGSTASVSFKLDNKWMGRIYDYYVLEYEDRSLILDRSTRWRYRFPRYPKYVRCLDYINLCSILRTSVFEKISEKDRQTIKSLVSLLNESWGNQLNDSDYLVIEDILKKFCLRVKYLHKSYLRLFNQIKPKILFIEDASYGGRNAWFIKWARDCGIITGEFQHGCMDIPYIYGERLLHDPEYKKYLPDYLLMYGQYWKDLASSPSTKIIIGNPHFDIRNKELKDVKKKEAKKVILIVSQGTVTNILVELTVQLAKKCEGEDYKIIYRLHPGEVPFVNRYERLKGLNNVRIDKQEDIYELIHEADYVVGSNSLTLFEAVGFSKKIYILKSVSSEIYMPRDIGERFINANDLFDLIKKDKHQSVKNIDIYWADHWQENYHQFINSILGKRGSEKC